MRRIEVHWESLDAAGVKGDEVIEVEDDATEEDISEAAAEVAFEHFSYGWSEVKP